MDLGGNEALVTYTGRFIDIQSSNRCLLGGARAAKHETTVTTMMSSVGNSEENLTFVTLFVIRISSPHRVPLRLEQFFHLAFFTDKNLFVTISVTVLPSLLVPTPLSVGKDRETTTDIVLPASLALLAIRPDHNTVTMLFVITPLSLVHATIGKLLGSDAIALVTVKFTLVRITIRPTEDPITLFVSSNPISFVLSSVTIVICAFSVHKRVFPFSCVFITSFPSESSSHFLIFVENSFELVAVVPSQSSFSMLHSIECLTLISRTPSHNLLPSIQILSHLLLLLYQVVVLNNNF
mmetsp:Transcript_20428/g.31885  ORF Transcript_20428/g.31885 Transcript_20428/m.31885 type:complete len:294 (-) Transcript_20428:68-949(-)